MWYCGAKKLALHRNTSATNVVCLGRGSVLYGDFRNYTIINYALQL